MTERDPRDTQSIAPFRQWLTVHELLSIGFGIAALLLVLLFTRKSPNPYFLAGLVVAVVGMGLLSFFWAAKQ